MKFKVSFKRFFNDVNNFYVIQWNEEMPLFLRAGDFT